MREGFAREIEDQGFAVIANLISCETVKDLIAATSEYGHTARNLLESEPQVASLARLAAVRAPIEEILGPNCFAVRGLFFDKTSDANWKVAWHQDLTIAVRRRFDVSGFGPWSEKAGIPHVQPPTATLERMLSIRIHLDDCGTENGPLQVVPGSHRLGRLDTDEISTLRRDHEERPLTASSGSAVLMKPLLLHASSASVNPAHRRVIHLEFAAEELPKPLEWHGRW
jgi:ectoine hydroxylase-related dioxygenase (phytanoyl-CoA dioxygenase family)